MFKIKWILIICILSVQSYSFAIESSFHCSNKEKWNFKNHLSDEYQDYYSKMTRGLLSPIEGFAHALALRKSTQNHTQRVFAEFWISRAFYEAGLFHIAYTGFQSIAQRPLADSTSNIQLASLECISRINDEFPSFKITPEVIKPFLGFKKKSLIVAEALTKHVLDFPHTQANNTTLSKAIEGLSEGRHFLWLAEGVYALKNNQKDKVISHFSEYLKTPNPLDHLPLFKRHNDFVHLSLAHNFYEQKKYSHASYHFQKIPRSSNLLTFSLTGYAWSELMQAHYGKAIGTTMQFNVGGIRQTYAPEAFMILAMSLNEICQFPSALNAIQLFFDSYKEEYEWLKEWQKSEKPLYSIAIESLKPKNNIPVKISSEWIRTPLFLGRQEEINLIFRENKKISELEQRGAQLQQRQAQKIIQDIRIILSEFNRLKENRKSDIDLKLPDTLLGRIEKVKQELLAYQRIKSAAPLWHQIVQVNKNRTESRRNSLVAQINSDLKSISKQMIQDLNSISDNIQLIKMEIYNGATHDLVWQNANPDFREVSKKIERSKTSKTKSADVWNWGDISGVLKGNEEVWEDEVGAFQASLSNNCENKEKYLALKKEELIINRAPTQTN